MSSLSAGSFVRRPDGGHEGTAVLEAPEGSMKVNVDARAAPTDHELRALNELMANWPVLRRALERPLFAFYYDTLVCSTDSGPRIARPEDVWKHVTIHELCDSDYRHGEHRYVRMLGACSWEEEHGLGIDVRDGADILYCGHRVGERPFEPPERGAWNFATPEQQERALAQEYIDDDDLERLAMESEPPEEARPRPVAQVSHEKRAWWKFW